METLDLIYQLAGSGDLLIRKTPVCWEIIFTDMTTGKAVVQKGSTIYDAVDGVYVIWNKSRRPHHLQTILETIPGLRVYGDDGGHLCADTKTIPERIAVEAAWRAHTMRNGLGISESILDIIGDYHVQHTPDATDTTCTLVWENVQYIPR